LAKFDPLHKISLPEKFSSGRLQFLAIRGRWWSAMVNGGGSNGQWCKVVVNGEKIRKRVAAIKAV